MSKETYKCEKRHIYTKRALRKRPEIRRLCQRELNLMKETRVYAKRDLQTYALYTTPRSLS